MVGGAPAATSTNGPPGIAKPATSTSVASTEAFDPKTSGLGAPSQPRSIAQQLTADDFSLTRGPPIVAAKAVVSDALELFKESGVSSIQALATASMRLGVPLGDAQAVELATALGPASLPLLSAAEARVALTSWKLELADVLPALLEQGLPVPELYQQSLKALVANPSLRDEHVMALQDALVRSALSGTVEAPLLDGSLTLNAFVTHVNALGSGEAFGESLPVVARLIKKGYSFDAGMLRPLADSAVTSPDIHTRRQAASVFWHSSTTSESAVKAYLQGILDRSKHRSHQEGIAHFEEHPSWSSPGELRPALGEEWSGEVLQRLLESAPANAEILPVVTAASWFRGKGETSQVKLREVARASVAWSTLPPKQLVAAADALDGYLQVNEARGDVLAGLLRKHPELAGSAPGLMSRLAGGELSALQFSAARFTEAPDFLAELRVVKGELEAAPLPSWLEHSDSPIWERNAKRTRQYRLSHFDRVLGLATPEAVLRLLSQNPFGQTGHDPSVLAQGRELGLSAQQMFDALEKRDLEGWNTFDAAAELLTDPSISSSSFEQYFIKVFAGVSAGPRRVKLLEALMRRAATKGEVIAPIHQAVTAVVDRKQLHEDLLAAGLSRELVLAFFPQAPTQELRFAPSNELPRTLREARDARLADFQQRALSADPLPTPMAPGPPRGLDTSVVENAFSAEVLALSEEARDARFGTVDVSNPARFLIDVRKGRSYGQLKARYFHEGGDPALGLGLKWARADEAAPAKQLEALFGHDSVTWLEVLGTLALPASTLEVRRRAVVSALSGGALRERGALEPRQGLGAFVNSLEAGRVLATPGLTADQQFRAVEAALSETAISQSEAWAGARGVVAGFEGSLDFVAPTLLAAVHGGSAPAEALTSWLPVLTSLKLSKAAALEVVWRLAEQVNSHSSLGLDPRFAASPRGQSGRAAIRVIDDFAETRSDLTDAERTHLRGALGYLSSQPLPEEPPSPRSVFDL